LFLGFGRKVRHKRCGILGLSSFPSLEALALGWKGGNNDFQLQVIGRMSTSSEGWELAGLPADEVAAQRDHREELGARAGGDFAGEDDR